ncbi:MAG: 1,2-phenylacetyl-CoA epoxidase subunit B [Actinomycetota bacterium]
MKVYEVFTKKAGKDAFRHAGSLEAADDDLAMLLARDSYCRRGEGEQLWLVERSHVLVADAELLAVTADLPHRSNNGEAVAARRRALREEAAE